MELPRTFYLLSLTVTIIKCAPSDPSFYTAIFQNCPLLTTSLNHPIFQTCSNWDRISKTQNFTDETRNDVLCLLYFHTFTLYCNQSKQINTSAYSVDINTLCDNLDIIPEQAGPESVLRKIITTKEICVKLCSDSFGEVVPICSKCYYYSHHFESKKNPMLNVQKNNPTHLISLNRTKVEPELPDEQKELESKVTPKEITQTEDEITEKNKVKKKVDAVSEKTSGDKPPSVASGGDVNLNSHSDDTVVKADSDVKPNNKQTENEDKFKRVEDKPKPPEEKNVEQSKLVLALTSPINVDNNQNTQVDKNLEKIDGGDNEDFVNGDINPPNNDRLESEEEMEEQPNQLGDKSPKPKELDETDEAVNYTSEMDGDSYFFTYFMLLCVIFIVGYVCYHNKQKILALILEGRRGKRQYRGRRPNSANYHKLDSNLEEAITSSCNKNTNNIIY